MVEAFGFGKGPRCHRLAFKMIRERIVSGTANDLRDPIAGYHLHHLLGGARAHKSIFHVGFHRWFRVWWCDQSPRGLWMTTASIRQTTFNLIASRPCRPRRDQFLWWSRSRRHLMQTFRSSQHSWAHISAVGQLMPRKS